ncbi:hypothetical protein ACJQWK_07255 [Exserohilum turcicum]
MARTRLGHKADTTASSNTRSLRSHTKEAPKAATAAIEAAAASRITRVTKKRRTPADPSTNKRKPSPQPRTDKRKSNPKPKPCKPPPDHFTCRICIEVKPADDFIQRKQPTRGQQRRLDAPRHCLAHLARDPTKKNMDPVCKSCVGNTMSAKLDTLGARQVSIGCLEPGCTEPWNHMFIMRYMPPGAPLEKYNVETFQVWKESAEAKLVPCPSPDCNDIGQADNYAPGYPQVACNTCSSRSCAQCLVPWHTDLTCAEYTARHVDEQMSDPEKTTLELMQSRDAKRCPNCHMVIEKDGGCDGVVRDSPPPSFPDQMQRTGLTPTFYLVMRRLPQVFPLG